jgi:hypothetical protein
MSIKTGITAIILSFACAMYASAFGIGLQLDGNYGYSGTAGGVSVAFKLDDVPFYFAANVSASQYYGFGAGLTGDYWFFDETITKELPLKWFFGVGFYGGFYSGKGTSLSLGVRLPIGINAFFADNVIEPYLMLAPQLGVALGDNWHFPDWSFPLALGVRFWIK